MVHMGIHVIKFEYEKSNHNIINVKIKIKTRRFETKLLHT